MKYKLITFDLDDTFWDIAPVIIKAERDTRQWLHKEVGEIEWGSMSDFLGIREELIKTIPSLEWDISLLRKEIYKQKLKDLIPDESERDHMINKAYSMFLEKRHEVTFYEGVYDAIKSLASKYHLGILTNGNADIYKYDIGQYFAFSIRLLKSFDKLFAIELIISKGITLLSAPTSFLRILAIASLISLSCINFLY